MNTATAFASRAERGVVGVEAAQLCRIFDALFQRSENTRLSAGADEPLYLPATADSPCNEIRFRHDYPASALHEIAHWCIAGAHRRTLVDYGYWYAPDGRDRAQQVQFEQLEARPQALEWLFSVACGLVFQPSIDNLSGQSGDEQRFVQAIAQAAQHYCTHGLPPRAARFHAGLRQQFGGPPMLNVSDYTPERLAAVRSC